MTAESVHYREDLDDLLDGRLEPTRRAVVEAHLQTCAQCRREWNALQRVKESLRSALSPAEPPPQVTAAIRAQLAREPLAPRRGRIGAAVAVGLAAAAAVLVAVWIGRRIDPPAEAAATFLHYKSGDLPLDSAAKEPAELEEFFRRSGIPFRTRVFDLGMMNYRLAGGRVTTLGGRKSAMFVYRGPGNRLLICEMFEGRTSDLPRGGSQRVHEGIVFHVYRDRGLTEVFWQEGPVTCVLVSDASPEETIALAYAKAARL